MNKIKMSFLCSVLVGSCTLNALEVKQGWNLVSLASDVNAALFDKKEVRSVWSYDKKWLAYSSDENYSALLKNENFEEIGSIKSSQGFWVHALEPFSQNVAVSQQNDINITNGWNLIGTIEEETSLKEIDPDALFWKYSDNQWFLGDTLSHSAYKSFSTISKEEGVWIASSSDFVYKEDRKKKFLFLNEKLIPQSVDYEDINSSFGGFVHHDVVGDFHFQNNGYIPFSAGFEQNELVSEYVSGEDENYAVFLEDATNQVRFEKDSTEFMKVPYFILPDYFLNFEDIKFIAIEAKPVKPLLMSEDVLMILSNVSLKQSVTLSFEKISSDAQLLSYGTFISGVSTEVKNSQKEIINPLSINGQMNLKPIFKNISEIPVNPYVYVLNDGTWELLGPALYKNGSLISKNWYNKFTSFAVVDVDDANLYTYNNVIQNEQKQALRDVLVVSNNKLAVSTSNSGEFTYNAPSTPQRLVAYKKGYKPLVLDLNTTQKQTMFLETSLSAVDGLDAGYDENFKIVYTVGEKNKEFTYIGENYDIRPKLIANTDAIIYTAVYKYQDGYVFGASDSRVLKVGTDSEITKLREGDGIIYDGFVVENNNTIYYGTFSDTFTQIDENSTKLDDELSGFDFLKYGLSVAYKPFLTEDKVYIPLFNQSEDTKTSLYVKGRNDITTNNLDLISNIGTPGKLSQIDSDIVFGTSDSKIVFVDTLKDTDAISKTIEFSTKGIIAKVVQLENALYAIDLNGLLKNLDTNQSIQLTPSSNLIATENELIVADHNGKVYHLSKELQIIKEYQFDGAIIAEPLVYNANLYTITSNGKFYVNEELIGTFNTKVTNINRIEESIVFGGENGAVWKIEIKKEEL